MAKIKKCLTQYTLNKIKMAFSNDSEILKELEHLPSCSKRKLSDYQIFLSTCLKSGKTIKECAINWKLKKDV